MRRSDTGSTGLANSGILRIALEKEGHDVVVKRTAAGAYQSCREAKFDLLVIDIWLPDVDGWAFYDLARPVCDAPVIAITSHIGDGDLERSRQLGFVAHLLKPVDLDILLELIRNLPPRATR